MHNLKLWISHAGSDYEPSEVVVTIDTRSNSSSESITST